MKENGIVFSDCDVLSNTQSGFDFFRWVSTVFKSDTGLFTYEFSSCEDSNILKLCFSIISERWCLNSTDFKIIFDSVQNQTGKQFALNVFSDNQEWFLFLISDFKERKNFSNISEFFFNDKYITVLELNFLFLFVSNEVRRNVSSIEFQTIYELDFMMKSFTFLDSDSSMNTNFFV